MRARARYGSDEGARIDLAGDPGSVRDGAGNLNIAVGYQAGSVLGIGNHNIFVDHPGVGDESKTMRLGNLQKHTFIAGIATATVSGATVEIDTTTGQLGIAPSSARYKRDISRPRISLDTSLEGMMLLQRGGHEQTQARPEGHGRRAAGARPQLVSCPFPITPVLVHSQAAAPIHSASTWFRRPA